MTKTQLKRYSLDAVVVVFNIITTRAIAESIMSDKDVWERPSEKDLKLYCKAG
jgi:hypothetical protein